MDYTLLGTTAEMPWKKRAEQGTKQTKRSRKVVKDKQTHKQKQHSLQILLVAPRRLSPATTKKRSDGTILLVHSSG